MPKEEAKVGNIKIIEKDFAELYIGKNPKALREEYEKKKRKTLCLLLAVGFLLVILLGIQEKQSAALPEENSILRGEYGQGSRQVELEVKPEHGGWERFSFSISEREYAKEEIEEMFYSLRERLPEEILGKNTSLDEVRYPLQLFTEVEGYPLTLSWESSRKELMKSDGSLTGGEIAPKGELVELTVAMEYGEWRQMESFYVRLLPEEGGAEGFLSGLSRYVEEAEKENREKKTLQLPGEFEETALSWRKKTDKTYLFMGVLLLILLPVISKEKDKELHKKAERRRKSLQNEYSEFVSKLILFLEAGMNVKGSLFRMVEDYSQKKRESGKEEYLYEELQYMCRQISNGMSEREAYELFGTRCGLPLYKKLSTLLIQNLQKGSGGMLETLRMEAENAFEEKKNQVKKAGEEASTKLLFPMMLMLAIVMILIIVPAGFSFQV